MEVILTVDRAKNKVSWCDRGHVAQRVKPKSYVISTTDIGLVLL